MHARFDTESRIAVAQAADLAREMGHREVGPGHLLLGLLANPRGAAYAALWDHGLNLDTARDLVAANHVDEEPEPDHTTEPGHAPGYDDDREALEAIGIDLDRVREAVRANLGEDLAGGWAARPDRRTGKGRRRGGRRGRRQHRHHDDRDGAGNPDSPGHEQHHDGRGRRGPRSRRDDGPRFSRPLRALLRDVRRTASRDRAEAEGRDEARRVPGMTGARLLVALTRSDDPAVTSVFATSTDIEGLRAQAQAALRPSTNE